MVVSIRVVIFLSYSNIRIVRLNSHSWGTYYRNSKYAQQIAKPNISPLPNSDYVVVNIATTGILEIWPMGKYHVAPTEYRRGISTDRGGD